MAHIPYEDGDPKAVFARKKGVCAGYARLVQEIGKLVGLDVRYVTGDVRNSEGSTVNGIGHAWNIAKADGEWYLLDPTWDAGTVDGDTFKKRYTTSYLFAPPEVFGLDHFPDKPWEQLREKPLELAEWLRLPMLLPDFFANHLQLISPDRSQITIDGDLPIEVQNPDGVWILLNRSAKGGFTREHCGRATLGPKLFCELPGKGTYDVRLFLGNAEFGSFKFAGQIEVNRR
jgi:transglutaminase/protease-like cytokinesis protein 3